MMFLYAYGCVCVGSYLIKSMIKLFIQSKGLRYFNLTLSINRAENVLFSIVRTNDILRE